MKLRHLTFATVLGGLLAGGRPASAQEFPMGIAAQVASGVEGGGQGPAAGVRRARTTVRLGAELPISAEDPGPRFAAGLLLEIEPHSSLGADLRYVHLVDNRFAFHVGAVGIFAPAMLFGATAGADFRLALGRRAMITLGPQFRGFFFGNDLADGAVIWQGLFNVGIHVNLH
jgi:hypothetical protein